MNEKKYLSADEYLRDTWKLAAAVRKSGWKPDILIALWRGGAAVGVALHEYFKVSGWSVQHIPLKCASYTGIGQNPGGVEFTHGDLVFGLLRPGDRVLVVDDVFDTGKTARAVKERIASREIGRVATGFQPSSDERSGSFTAISSFVSPSISWGKTIQSRPTSLTK